MTVPRDTKPVVAVVFDFDDTLAPDSTSQLLAALGVADVPAFWRDEVEPLVRSGWDPVPAYLYRVIEWSEAGRFAEPLGHEPIERSGRGGIPLSVVDPMRQERWEHAWGFIEEGPSMNVCPTDFSPGSTAEMILSMALQGVCDRISLQGRVYER
jgi:hypothetical protein